MISSSETGREKGDMKHFFNRLRGLNKIVLMLALVLISVIMAVTNQEPEANILPIVNTPLPAKIAAEFVEECKWLVGNRLEDAKLTLHNNKTALEILEKECLWVMDHSTLMADFDGDDKNEIAMITSGAGCGSCHIQEIHIIKDDKIIFYESGTDFTIEPARDFVGFILLQVDFPERIEEVYAYNKESGTFVKTSERKTILKVD